MEMIQDKDGKVIVVPHDKKPIYLLTPYEAKTERISQ